jgi:hypothetical protein
MLGLVDSMDWKATLPLLLLLLLLLLCACVAWLAGGG